VYTVTEKTVNFKNCKSLQKRKLKEMFLFLKLLHAIVIVIFVVKFIVLNIVHHRAKVRILVHRGGGHVNGGRTVDRWRTVDEKLDYKSTKYVISEVVDNFFKNFIFSKKFKTTNIGAGGT
jgi:hypothetical protein